jgi:hypothetical protein
MSYPPWPRHGPAYTLPLSPRAGPCFDLRSRCRFGRLNEGAPTLRNGAAGAFDAAEGNGFAAGGFCDGAGYSARYDAKPDGLSLIRSWGRSLTTRRFKIGHCERNVPRWGRFFGHSQIENRPLTKTPPERNIIARRTLAFRGRVFKSRHPTNAYGVSRFNTRLGLGNAIPISTHPPTASAHPALGSDEDDKAAN